MPTKAIPGLLIGFACALLCTAALAGGSPRPSVVVVRPDVTDPRLAEALTRVQAELRTAGFDVTIVGRDAEAQSSEPAPAAVIAVSGDATTGLEFRIADRRGGRTVIRRMAPEGEAGKRAPEILAIYAVELLLASLAELDITPAAVEEPPAAAAPPPAQEPAPPPPPPAPPPAEPASETKVSRIGFEPGLGVAVSGVGTAVLPVARLQYALLPAVQLRLTGAGLGTRPEISGDAGTARISQGFVLGEAIARPYEGASLAPRLSAGAGAYYVGVDGRGAPPFEGKSASRWSVALDIGAGVSFRRSSALEIALEAHALFAYPYTAVRFLDEKKATAGRPTLILTATVIGWL